MTSSISGATARDGSLVLDAEALYGEFRTGVSRLLREGSRLVGIPSGGAWLAERLHADLGLPDTFGVISSAMHRDDFAERGLSSQHIPTKLPFEIRGAHIVLIDDVLFTGRTIRAVINELFDFGRPASVQLAVLVDRGGRELPIQADYAAARMTVSPQQMLALRRDAGGALAFQLEPRNG